MQRIAWLSLFLATVASSHAIVFSGSNPPNTASQFSFDIGAGATNVSLSLPGNATAYSFLYLKKNSAATSSSYDFSSQVSGNTNSISLELPEASVGTWYVSVSTPAGSSTHNFSLAVDTNRNDLRLVSRVVSKVLGSQAQGSATNAQWQYFKLELPSSGYWSVSVVTTNQTAPDLYVGRNQLPTTTSYLKRSTGLTNDLIAFTPSETPAGVYYVGLYGASAPPAGVPFTLRFTSITPVTLPWDPGTAHLGTEVYTNLNGVAGDYYFRIVTANPSVGAWRTALRVLTPTNDANLYLGRGFIPSPATNSFKSELPGSDGAVLALTAQFQPGEEWFFVVRANAGAQWTLLSGTPFVTDLGTIAADDSTGSGDVEIGPEGLRFFSATPPPQMLAWRLFLNGLTNSILLKKAALPLPGPGLFELTQTGQMLVVPPYLTSLQYYIAVKGAPGTMMNLDSRQQQITDLAYGASITRNLTGYGYSTYRIEVPANEIAWQTYLPSTNGNPNVAIRRSAIPNELYNDAYSELAGTNADNITIVPPALSDGTFYITVYSTNVFNTNGYHFNLQSGPARVTDIDYHSVVVNDDPSHVGWRFYRVADVSEQLNSLGWDLYLTNHAKGTRIALRRANVPGQWSYRTPSVSQAAYYDVFSTGDFLQRPDHQPDVWYIGVYNPTNALGPFTLVTRDLMATPITDSTPILRTSVLSGRWEFFSVTLGPEDFNPGAGLGALLGWDVRLTNVTSGFPKVVVRREKLPVSLLTTFTTTDATWPSGGQWAPGQDWTKRSLTYDGATNEDGRILVMPAGRPLGPATYYIGVLNATGTNNMTYSLQSRFIGDGRDIPVTEIPWTGAAITNSIPPREAAYYRVVIPAQEPSWKVLLTPTAGDALLIANATNIPAMDTGKRMSKAGKEQYVRLPNQAEAYLREGTNYLVVISEGQNATVPNRIGAGPSTYTLATLGVLPATLLGTLTTTDLVANATLDGGAVAAYHFNNVMGTLGFWITVNAQAGNPWAVSRGDPDLADPSLKGEYYGTDGGQGDGAVASSGIIRVADPYPTETIMVKARQGVDGSYPDSTYTLSVKPMIPTPLDFDGGVFDVRDQPADYQTLLAIDVPDDALGWDLRLTNVISGDPQLVVARDAAPIGSTSYGWGSGPWTWTDWPSGFMIAAGSDWTGRSDSPDGEWEYGRVLTLSKGRPLKPGRYYVGVIGLTTNVNCTVISRGIGKNYSIPVTDLDFNAGQSDVPDLSPREVAYYHINIPTNAQSWKVQLTGIESESMLVACKDTLPTIWASQTTTVRNSAGRRAQRLGDENFLLLPPSGQTYLTGGDYYLAVVSEGRDATNSFSIGTGTSSFSLLSLGESPIFQLGDAGSGELTDTNGLVGGDTRIYQFTVPEGIQSLEARIENRVGNPVMELLAGSRAPDPGASLGAIFQDTYGNESGQIPGSSVTTSLITVANPTNGTYTLVVKARSTNTFSGINQVIPDATYSIRVTAVGTRLLGFEDQAQITAQGSSTWKFFQVEVPTNALGWNLRLQDISKGLPKLVVARGSLPSGLKTTPWGSPGLSATWATNAQWAPGPDWTRRGFGSDGVINEDGRIFAAGLNRPLQPGTYFIGVNNLSTSNSATYTLVSRGIGPGFTIPIVDLPFVGSATNSALPAREAAYYRVVIPTNTPSWKVKLTVVTNIGGESMLAGLRGALPNSDTVVGSGLANGKAMQKPGNENFVLMPVTGTTNVTAGTNYLAVISEGLNPINAKSIGVGGCAYVLHSEGSIPVRDLGVIANDRILETASLDGGEVRAYQFIIPQDTGGVQLKLDNRSGNPAMVLLQGNRLPDPGAGISGLSADAYGNEGGYPATTGHASSLTLANPLPGTYTLMVKARAVGSAYPDANYTLRVERVTPQELNFAANLNTNGFSNFASGLLADNERSFFKVVVPATNNGVPVIGWKLTVDQSSGTALVRVRKDSLPGDSVGTGQTAFTTNTAVLVAPFLTNGTWFVEVKGSGSTAFSLESSALELERPAWTMPGPSDPQPTGLVAPVFADTGVDTNGIPQPGDQSTFLDQNALHYYAINVPTGNAGLLRTELRALSGNPDLYLRYGTPPTVHHNTNGAAGTIYERSMLLSTNTEYANWVPLDGKVDTALRPGLYYLAVRATGNSNARYRLLASLGNLQDIQLNGDALTNQTLLGGDWAYYRLPTSTELPMGLNVTFSQDYGDVVLYLRNGIPPGNGATPNVADIKHWDTDKKNPGPYKSFDAPGTYTISAPPARPGEMLYLGFRAASRATFSVQVATNGVPVAEPEVVSFYGGTASANVEGFSTALFRVDVPLEATRWKHYSTHATNLVVYMDQGTLPVLNSPIWKSANLDSSCSTQLVAWNAISKQYDPGKWPWVPGQSYYLLVTNRTSTPQDFTLNMDGKNSLTDDNDLNGMVDAWELLYFGKTGQLAGADPDKDGVSNLSESVENTNPLDPNSYAPRLYISAQNGAVLRDPDLNGYPLGSTVTLTPLPAPGYGFAGWSGDASGRSNPLSLTMDAHKTLTARFRVLGDDFIVAIPITASTITLTATNTSFTKEAGEPNHAGVAGGKSIWWRWTAPSSGEATLSTAGSSFTTLLAVYTGEAVSNLTTVASAAAQAGDPSGAQLSFQAVAGTVYSIAVDGAGGVSGSIVLNFSGPAGVIHPELSSGSMTIENGVLKVAVSGEGNRTYVIEYSDDLVTWHEQWTITTAADGSANFLDLGAGAQPRRFYRARLQ